MPSQSLRGTGVAVITPFQPNFSVDYLALERIIRHLCVSGGVDYLVLLGTTAETVSLRLEEKQEILRFVFEEVRPNVPIVVGVGGNNMVALENDLATLPLARAHALMVVTPYYNKPSQAGLYAYYADVHARTQKPILMYNVPSRTGVTIHPDTVVRLAADCPRIIGIKEASADMSQCIAMRLKNPAPFLVLSGNDAFVAPLIGGIGMDGVISVCANAFPREVAEMTRTLLARRTPERSHALFLHELDRLCFIENNPAGVKYFMSQMGLCENVLRLPLVPLSAVHTDSVREFMKNACACART